MALALALVMAFAMVGPMPIRAEEAGNILHVTGRTNSWDGVDIHRLGMEEGDVLVVEGRADGQPPAGTQMVLGGAESPWNWAASAALSDANQEFIFELVLEENHMEDEQFVRIRVQTNGEGATMSFFVYEIQIVRDGVAIYSLRTDEYVQEASPGTATELNDTPELQRSGGPNITITTRQAPQEPGDTPPPQEGEGILHITNRTADWNALDIHRGTLELGDEITVTGRVDGQPPEGTQMILGGAENPWNWATNTPVTEANQGFVLSLTLADNHMEEEQFIRFRVQTNADGATMPFFIDDIVIIRDGNVVYALSADPFVQGIVGSVTTLSGHPLFQIAGNPIVTVVPAGTQGAPPSDPGPGELGPLEVVHLVNFEDDTYEAYIVIGAQMEGEIVAGRGIDGTSAMRLANVTGDYTSGDGNFLLFSLPEALPIGSTVEISWYVFIPSAENPGDRTIVGPGLNINGQFGSAPHQPTNTDPEPGDLAREIPMDQWVNTTVEFTLGPAVGDLDFLIFRFRVNNNEQQPSVLYIDDITISTRGVADVFIPTWDLTLPSLAETFADYFMIGNIWSNPIQMNIGNTQEMFIHHFNSVTAENHHKPDSIAGSGPDPATWNFETQDLIVDFAEANNLAMVGHTLIWHAQSPLWLTNVPGTTEPLTRAEAMENMRLYISTIAGRYTGRMQAWDVLNEAFTTSVGTFSGDWRNHLRTGDYFADNHTRWYDAFANGASDGEAGYDYIFYAFYFARIYDPHATLFYNDFNEEQPGKREAIAQMVDDINERWANHPSYDGRLLIEGIGLQSHHHLDQWATNFDNIRPTIERFAQTGAVLAITELDITIGTQANPSIPLTPEQEARQAEYFARVFGYFVEFADYIERVTFWGKTDTQSWRSWGSPLIFDGNFEAKDSFFAVIDQAVPQAPEEPTQDEPMPEEPTPAAPRNIRLFFLTNEGFEDIANDISYSHLMDVPAQILEGQILVPLRAIATALGAPPPSWNPLTGEVTLTYGGQTTTFAPLFIIDNRAMVSPDFIAEFFGADITILEDGLLIVK